MKFYYLLPLMALGVVSCSGNSNGEKSEAAEDTTAVEQVVAEEVQAPEAAPSEFFLTEDGFGALKLGSKVDDVKANPVENLYDKVTATKSFNEMLEEETISGEFTLNGENVGSFAAEANGVIYFIQFDAPFVKLKVNDKVYSIGDSFQALAHEKGATIDDYGSVIINGIMAYDGDGKITAFNLGSPF